MCEDPKHTSDERYLRTEAKIQNTIDTMFEQMKVVTKVREFCVSAEITSATFYSHYSSISEVIFERDVREAKKMAQYLIGAPLEHVGKLSPSKIRTEIIFQKTFHYIDNHKNYFKGVASRNSIYPYKSLVIILKPQLWRNWREYHNWDQNRETKLEKVCHKLTFEVAGVYSEWVEYDIFAPEKIEHHTEHLVYLIDTACQRLDR